MRKVTALKLAIVAGGRPQKDVAADAGMSEAELSRIVNGLHASEAKRQAIADVLGRTVDELWPSEQAAA